MLFNMIHPTRFVFDMRTSSNLAAVGATRVVALLSDVTNRATTRVALHHPGNVITAKQSRWACRSELQGWRPGADEISGSGQSQPRRRRGSLPGPWPCRARPTAFPGNHPRFPTHRGDVSQDRT